MDNNSEYIEDLRIIKKVMEGSSRFLSLSGLSGFFAGIIALAGAAYSVPALLDGNILLKEGMFAELSSHEITILELKFSVLGFIVLSLAIAISLWFSFRKSKKTGTGMWTPVSKRLLINLLIPLATGGILIILFMVQHTWWMIIPAMLIFYGLSLVSAGKFTYNDILYLGLAEIVTGLVAAALPSYGIFLWSFGFGVLHIIYGLMLYGKYER